MVLNDSDERKWIIGEHTKVKHELFSKYLNAAIQIMATQWKQYLIIDGYAGAGKYNDGSEGSPLKSIEVAYEKINQFPQIQKIVIINCEPKNFDVLRQNLEEKMISYSATYPNIRKITYFYEDFNTIQTPNDTGLIVYTIKSTFEEFMQYIEGRNVFEDLLKSMPVFFFIDPFGFKLNFEYFKKISRFHKAELFIHLMSNSISRFWMLKDREACLNQLFGCEDWKNIIEATENLKGKRKIDKISAFFIDRLKNDTNFRFCWPFNLVNAKTNYYFSSLIYCTKNQKGLEVMKNIMKKAGSLSYEFNPVRDNKAKSLDSFIPKEQRYSDLESYIKEIYCGYDENLIIEYSEIYEDILKNTRYTKSELDVVLKKLKTEGKIIHHLIKGKEMAFHDEDYIEFI